MRISAVVPVYNIQSYIVAMIDSLLRQTYQIKEIVVVDDQSTDDTLVLVNHAYETNKMVKIVPLSQNKGVSFARNEGVRRAAGDWILFMDGDDVAHPELVETLVHSLNDCRQRFPVETFDVVYPSYYQVDENLHLINEWKEGKLLHCDEAQGELFLRNCIMTTSGILLNKDVFKTAGGFNEALSYAEDWDLWLHIAEHSGFAHSNECLVDVRRHSGNASGKIKNMLEHERKILRSWPLSTIKNAIFKRNKSQGENTADFVALLFRLNMWEQGYKELSLLIPEFQNALIYFLQGLYYLRQGKWSDAEQAFLHSLSMDKNQGAVLNNLGGIYLLKGKKTEADSYLKKALDLHPNYMDAESNSKLQLPVEKEEIHFTWRKLRKQLTSYSK